MMGRHPNLDYSCGAQNFLERGGHVSKRSGGERKRSGGQRWEGQR